MALGAALGIRVGRGAWDFALTMWHSLQASRVIPEPGGGSGGLGMPLTAGQAGLSRLPRRRGDIFSKFPAAADLGLHRDMGKPWQSWHPHPLGPGRRILIHRKEFSHPGPLGKLPGSPGLSLSCGFLECSLGLLWNDTGRVSALWELSVPACVSFWTSEFALMSF